MYNENNTPITKEFSERALRVKADMDAAVAADESLRVRITEAHFIAILLPIFTAISNDEHPSLDPWFTLAGHQHNQIEVYASAGGRFGEFPDYDKLLFIVPPILERFSYDKDNYNRAVSVIMANDPQTIPKELNGSVAHDLTTIAVNNKNRLSGFVDNELSMNRSILFGIAMYSRYNLPWFTDPDTGKRYANVVSTEPGVETEDATEYQESIDIGELDEL